MKRCQEALPVLSEVAEHVLKRPAQVDCVLVAQGDTPTAGGPGGPQAKPTPQSGRSRLAEEAKSRFDARPFRSN